MTEHLIIARNATTECVLQLDKANRHGLITGATGTGKTVTLQALAEQFSRQGVPVFMADIKGDLTGVSQPGKVGDKLAKVLTERKLEVPESKAFPVTLWDVFGEQGHPVRATVSDLGPLLLSRMFNLNETQAGVLQLVFKVADDQGMLLLDMKDLRSMCQHGGRQRQSYTTELRQHQRCQHWCDTARLATSGRHKVVTSVFGEPMLNIADFMQTDGGLGMINILAPTS
jgi:hypothetical protein